MAPIRGQFRFPRGGVPRLSLRIWGRDLRTGEIRILPVQGVTIEWTVEWPSGHETISQFTTPAQLQVDARSGYVTYPVSKARVAEIEGASRPLPTRIRAIMQDGTPVPYFTGDIAAEG